MSTGNKSMTGSRIYSLMLTDGEPVKVSKKYKTVQYKLCWIKVWEKLTPTSEEQCDVLDLKGTLLCTRRGKKLAEQYADQYIAGLTRIPFRRKVN